jgi:hypothetical protein
MHEGGASYELPLRVPAESTAAAKSPMVMKRRRRGVSQSAFFRASQERVPLAAATELIAANMHCTHIRGDYGTAVMAATA